MVFEQSSWVVHPGHGMAQVVAHETRVVGGRSVRCVVLCVPGRDDCHRPIRISVPAGTAESLGIRPPVDADEAIELLEVLGAQGGHVPANWSRRFKNHSEKLRSGDPYQCAEVVRNLARRERDAHLSNGEQAMYQHALYRLTSELAVTWEIELSEARRRITNAGTVEHAGPDAERSGV